MTASSWKTLGRMALAIAAVVAFYFSLLPVGTTGALGFELSRYSFAAIVFGRLIYVIVKAWRQSSGTTRSAEMAQRIYSVPRRFGLATIFLILFAFSILIASLNRLQLDPVILIFVLVFVGIVGVLQAVLDRAPRHASMIAGSLFFPVTFTIVGLASGNANLAKMPWSSIAFFMACWSVGGALLGYVTGTAIGGVFLLADKVAALLRGLKPH